MVKAGLRYMSPFGLLVERNGELFEGLEQKRHLTIFIDYFNSNQIEVGQIKSRECYRLGSKEINATVK